MSKRLSQEQEDLVHNAVDTLVETLSSQGNMDADEAISALAIIRARFGTLRPIDVMPEQE